MASPGHRPIANTDPERSGRTLERAPLRLTSKTSLPYYRGRRPAVPKRDRRFEALVEGTEGEAADEALVDVAAASFGATARLTDPVVFEVVLGEDDRERVSRERMALNPWRQICALRIVSQTGRTFVGTGWFIAPNVLATAGHCVFLQDEGGWAKSIRVIPAKHGATEPFGFQTSMRFASVDGWVKQRQRDFDYGVIFLDDAAPGTRIGNFGVQVLDDAEIKGIDAQISGYPADRDRATFQFFHLRPVLDVTATRLIYDIDTFGGQSGSPIWQETEENGLVAVGVHTTGTVSSNSGTRITGDVMENLIRWTME
jgi:glutamyl endopeptidase